MNLCTITMLTSEASVLRCSRSWAVLSMTLTLPPMSLAVPAKLLFQVDPVVDQQNLEVRQVRRGAQHPGDEDHGERLARALRVPDDARALLRRLPVRRRSTILRAARYC